MSRSSISISSMSDSDYSPTSATKYTTNTSTAIITITIINPTPYPLQAIKNNHGWDHLQDTIRPNSDGTLILQTPNTGKAAYILGDTGDVIEVAGGGGGKNGGRGDPMVRLCPEFGGGENEVLKGEMREPGHFVYKLPEAVMHINPAEDDGDTSDSVGNHFNPCL